MTAPDVCPNCGAEVPRNARVCPECGSDEQTGWSETAYASHLGLPDENFDHDEFGTGFGLGRHFGAAVRTGFGRRHGNADGRILKDENFSWESYPFLPLAFSL